MNAYNELYLDDAMANLGDMVEYAVCTLGYAPDSLAGSFPPELPQNSRMEIRSMLQECRGSNWQTLCLLP